AVLVATKRRALARVGRSVVVVRRRRLFLGGLLLAIGATAFVRAWPFVTAPYPPYRELGSGPHQALIDYVDRLGGATVWSFPEAHDSGEQWVGPVRVVWRTDPYTGELQRSAAAGLALAQFAVRAGERVAISGEMLAAPAGTALEVHVAVETLDGSAGDVRATLVRNGAVVAVWAGSTPLRQVHREVFDG